MTNATKPTSSPSTLEAGSPRALERQVWSTSTAPRYIGLFLWVVYFDQLPRWTLAVGGLLPAVLGALVAGLLCYCLLYYAPAMWGFKSGQPLTTLGTSTFGVTGARWLTGILIGLVQVVWFAVATFYATELTFEALVSCRLMNPGSLEPIHLGGLVLPSLVFLVTALTWSFAAALVGHYLLAIISALMNVFPVFMALLLAVAMGSTIGGVSRFQPLALDPATMEPVSTAGPRALTMMTELVFGFFATAGAMAADWGAVNRTERDVKLGGWFGVVFASWTVATLALLTVAGALGRLSSPVGPAGISDLQHWDFSFRSAVSQGIGGRLAGTILMVFGLGSLAPTCFSAYLFGHRFHVAWPRIKRIHWTLIGTTAAWLLIVGGVAGQLETIFSLMGAVVAPLVAALSADYFRQRGAWRGGRLGVNGAGVVAWAVGLAVGLVPIVSQAVSWRPGIRFQPAAVFAYGAAFVTYLILAYLGAEAPAASARSLTASDVP
jgi:cytosine permease